jgi:hypothetical protein
MAITAAIDLTVKKPDFKSMKSEIKELTIQAQQAVMAFGEFSPEAIRAEQALAQARDRMDDFNDRVAAVNPDKFAQINTVVQGVARGFQAAQGAMALFGNQSEDLEKTLVKLQGAMALAEGLEGLGKVNQQFTALANTIKGKVVSAFSTLRGAIIASGIGALAIALGYVVANFEKVSQAVLKLIPGLAQVGKIVGELVQSFTDFLGITSEAERSYKAFSKSITIANEDIQGQIDLLSVQGNKELEIFELRKKIINNQLSLIAKRKETAIKLTDEELEEEARLYRELNNKLKVTDAERQKFVEENNKTLTEYVEGFVKETQKIKDDAANAEKASLQKNIKDEYKLNQENWDRLADLSAKKLEEDGELLRQQYEKDLEKFVGQEDAKQELINLYLERQKALQATYNAERLAQNIEYNEKEVEINRKRDQQIMDARLSMAKSTVDGLTSLNTILTNEEKKRENIQKGIALVEIAIDSAIAFSNLNAESAQASARVAGILGPATPIFTAAYYAQGVARILGNVARAKQLLSGGSPSQGGNQGQTTNVQGIQQSVPQISSTLPRVNGFEQRVFVTEGDITRTQARVENAKRVSVVK